MNGNNKIKRKIGILKAGSLVSGLLSTSYIKRLILSLSVSLKYFNLKVFQSVKYDSWHGNVSELLLDKKDVLCLKYIICYLIIKLDL